MDAVFAKCDLIGAKKQVNFNNVSVSIRENYYVWADINFYPLKNNLSSD